MSTPPNSPDTLPRAATTPKGAGVEQWAKQNPLLAFCSFLGLPLVVFLALSMRGSRPVSDPRELHRQVSELVTSDKVYVRPYDPSASATIRVVVPVMTSEREAQEIGLSLRQFARKSGEYVVFRIETPAGQQLAVVNP